MSGLYEQQWQEAMAGATIQPSDGLWDNIATSLDKESGRHNWVTILLIAATVTVAFAFPLTIGNSSLQVRESFNPQIAQEKVENIDKTAAITDNSRESDDNSIAQANDTELSRPTSTENSTQDTASKYRAAEDNKSILARAEAKNGSAVSSSEITHKQTLTGAEAISVTGSSIIGYDMAAFDLHNSLKLADINDHYFIPFYLSSGSRIDRNLLASLNMGTGSLKAGNGLNGLNMQSADFAEPANNLGFANADERVENSGTTYYLGAGIELPVGKRWSLLAGVGYLAQKASGTSNMVLDVGNGNQPLGAYDPIVPGTIFLSESYSYAVTNSYINVPLTIKYPIINRKIKFRAGMGISTDFMISHTINSEEYGKVSYNPTSMEYKTVVLAGLINLDLSYSLNEQYSVALETGIRKGFTSIDEGKDFYPSSFTVGLILFYKIQ